MSKKKQQTQQQEESTETQSCQPQEQDITEPILSQQPESDEGDSAKRTQLDSAGSCELEAESSFTKRTQIPFEEDSKPEYETDSAKRTQFSPTEASEHQTEEDLTKQTQIPLAGSCELEAESSFTKRTQLESEEAETVQIQDIETPESTTPDTPDTQIPDITEPVLESESAESAEDETDNEPDDEPELIEGEFDTTLESVVEAVLFANDEPVSVSKLVEIAEAGSVKTIRKAIKTLNKKYRTGKFSFRIEELAGGYQMMTLSCFNPWLSKLIKVRSDNKLSPAQLETLAIVAYKQPIIRADVEAIRGVASGEVLRNLMYKGLVKIVGRAEILGRPMLYGTTKKFLDIFGLANLKDLPKIEELKNPEKGS